MITSLHHWIYCSLVFSSGLFVGVDKNQPLYDGRQLVTEVVGFLTPNQLADFTLSEVEDLIPVLAPVLTPIYRLGYSDTQLNPYDLPQKHHRCPS